MVRTGALEVPPPGIFCGRVLREWACFSKYAIRRVRVRPARVSRLSTGYRTSASSHTASRIVTGGDVFSTYAP